MGVEASAAVIDRIDSFFRVVKQVRDRMRDGHRSEPTDFELNALISTMPAEWRNRWCEECVTCMGCANELGELSDLGVTKQRWAQAAQDFRAAAAYREAMAEKKEK